MPSKSLSLIWEIGTPKIISYFWGFGSFLGIIMVTQMISGFVLALYYVSGEQAWCSVVDLTREVFWGWCLRLIHSNGASYVFIILLVHFFRGIFYSSFYLMLVWLSGLFIMFLTMAAAFLGYVLPWGQMSFWGATVIINLFSVLPMGKTLVIWLWGGFYVSNFTCSFFYATHFLIPFIILMMVSLHLITLHFSGSTSPSGLSVSNSMKIKFGLLFFYKDTVNIFVLWGSWLWCLYYPEWSADPINFSVSDLSNSPLHIQPEWYFLHYYAILRSIPNKVGGLMGFAAALILLTFLVLVWSNQSLNQISIYKLMTWTFFYSNILLMWLGGQAVEDPFIFMGQVLSFIYFMYMLLALLFDTLLFMVM